MVDVASQSSAEQTDKPVTIRMSQMAHFAVGFFTLGLLVPVLTWPWTSPLLIIPVLLSASVIRWRTVADRETVTARTLLGSKTVRWEQLSLIHI